MHGRFISFEGVDGAGKSTQLEAVASALAQRTVEVLRTREPGGTPIGEALRELMLGQDMAPMTETLLMFAARNEHVRGVIEPALARGQWVLCDRFLDASYAYQGAGRAVPSARLDALSDWVAGALRPDLTILVDVEPAVAQRRREQARTADRFEAESADFFERVRRAYRERAAREPARFLVVDGGADSGTVTSAILERIGPWLA